MRITEPRNRLRRFMCATKRSAADLAREVGCSRPTVSLILTGRRRPGLALALGIEEVTGGAIRAIEWVDVPVTRHQSQPLAIASMREPLC